VRRAFVLVSVLSLGAVPVLTGQQTLVGMYPAGVGLDSGQQATIPIVVDRRSGIQSLGAYQLQVTWNPAVLRYVRTSPPLNFGVPAVNESAVSSGSLTLAGARPDGAAGLFAIAHITFEMLVSSGSSPVTIVSPEFTASGTFAPIVVTPTPGSVCTSSGTYGDVNGDGAILSNDALLVVTAAVGLSIAPYTLASADVDSDGDADTRDALVILSTAVGLPTAGFRVGQAQGSACAGPAADTLAVYPRLLTVATGEVVPATATLYDAVRDPTSAQGLVWSSDAGGVATVDSAGRITAVGNGTATITASAIGVTPASVIVTVQPRHIWYVDSHDAAEHTIQLGSFAYPLADIQTAVEAVAPYDTILVTRRNLAYGPVVLTRPVTILGDSSFLGMPRIHNSTGPAIVSNAPGTVKLQNLALEESNAGLDARGDTLIVRGVSATSLRGPAFQVRGMQYASLWGITTNSAVLAGVLADSNHFVDINHANIRVIANRADSAAGIAVLHGDTAIVTDVKVLGVENGSAVVFSKLGRGVLDVFDVRAAGGVNMDSVGVLNVADGHIQDAGGGGDRALSIHADTVAMDSVIVDGAAQGVEISPMARDTGTRPNTFVNVTRSAVLNVAGAGGLIVDRIANVHLSRMIVRNVQLDHGIDVRRPTVVRIDSASVTGIGEGFAVRVDPAASLVMIGGKLRGPQGGLWADRVSLTLLTNLEVDSSAITPPFCFGCAPQFAIVVGHADSIVLDGLNLHDNVGGGLLVDSARTLAGRGSMLVRNQGQGGLGGGECEFGCEQQGSAKSAQFTLNQVPGAILTAVQQTHLAGWTVHDNTYGGLWIGWGPLVAPQAIIDTSSFRGNQKLLDAGGSGATPDAELIVNGGSFRNAPQAIHATFMGRLTVAGVLFDSASAIQAVGVVEANSVREVYLRDDTLTNGAGYGFQFNTVGYVDARRNVIRNRPYYDNYYPEAALDFMGVDSAFVYGNRLELNAIRGISLHGGGTGAITIDSNVVADDSSFAIQLGRQAGVTRNLFARNANAILVEVGGEPSFISQNNFEGNVFTAIRNESNDFTNAPNNWFNAPDGPQCTGVATGCTSATGDIVYGLNFSVSFAPFLTTRAGGAPIASPPIRTSARRVNR
jgi:hypothetical protein